MKNPVNLKQLEATASGAKHSSIKYYQKLATLNLAKNKQREVFSRNLALAGITGKDAEKQLAISMAGYMKQVRADTQKARIEIYKPLMDAMQSLKYAKSELSEPRRYASTYMLGSPERSRIEQTVSQMGLGAMKSMYERCMADPDSQESKLLAAVLCLAVDNVTPSARPFSSNQLAEEVYGAESQAVKKLVSDIEQEAQSIQAINRSFEDGKPIPANVKLALGMAYEGINISKALEGDDPEATADALTALQKIAGGLTGSSDKFDEHGKLMNRLQEERSKYETDFDALWNETLKENGLGEYVTEAA